MQRIGYSELQKRDFRAGHAHMKSTRFSSNVKRRKSGCESEIFELALSSCEIDARIGNAELQQQDFRAGPGRGRSLLELT